MRSTTSIALLGALASTASAQMMIPGLNATLSQNCTNAAMSLLTNGSFSQCIQAQSLLPLLSAQNESIVPVLDGFMNNLCNSAACTNETLNTAAQTLAQGCSAELQAYNISSDVVSVAFNQYPLARELLCTKTSDPYTEESYGGVLGAPPIPVSDPSYNSTEGTYCVTSVLTQLSAYFGTNLTVPFIGSLVTGGNTTALELASEIQANILCNDCIFGMVDIIQLPYPEVGDADISAYLAYLNVEPDADSPSTLNGVMNGTCAYIPLAVSQNGTLPDTVSVVIVDSTFPYNVTDGSDSTEGAMTASTPASTATSAGVSASAASAAGSAVTGATSAAASGATAATSAVASAASAATSAAASAVTAATSAAAPSA